MGNILNSLGGEVMRHLSYIALSVLCYVHSAVAITQLEDLAGCAQTVFICPKVDEKPVVRFILEKQQNEHSITFQSGEDERLVSLPADGMLRSLIEANMPNRNVGDIFVHFLEQQRLPTFSLPGVHYIMRQPGNIGQSDENQGPEEAEAF